MLVYDIGRRYLLPFLITGFMFPAFFAFRSAFEGMGDIRPVMVFNAAAFLLNIIARLCAWCFGHFGFPAMGGVGAAWATGDGDDLPAAVHGGLRSATPTPCVALKLYSQFARANLAPLSVNILATRHSYRAQHRRRDWSSSLLIPLLVDRAPGLGCSRRPCDRDQYRLTGIYGATSAWRKP